MKRIGFLCFLSIVFLAIFFHEFFLTQLAVWSLQAYSVTKWGKPLQYEKVILNSGILKIVKPRFENQFSFRAEELILTFQLDWKERLLHTHIEIDQPHWHLPRSSVFHETDSIEKLLVQEKKWFRTHPSFHISAGELTWVLDDFSDSHHMRFALEVDSKEGGAVKLHFDPHSQSSNCLELKILSLETGMEVQCNCQNVSCPSLAALIQFLNIPIPSLQLTSGIVEGELKAMFPKSSRPYLEGELQIDHLAFNQEGNQLQGFVEKARVKLEKNQTAYDKMDPVPTIMGEIEILKPASLHYRNGDHQWRMNQIEGSIQLNDIETVLINLKAQVGKTDTASFWSLVGKANLNAQRSLNLDIALLCTSLKNDKGKIQLILNQASHDCKCAQVELTSVGYEELDFLQSLLSTHWPAFQEIELKGGVFDAALEADVTRQGIGEIRLKQFQADGLISTFNPWKANCHFNQVRGYGKANLDREDFWKSVQAGLHLEEGQIDFEGISPPLPLTDIQAHLHIQKGFIDHSLVTLQLAGLKGKMDIEWGELKQLLTFKLDGEVEDLAELLPGSLQEGLKQHFYHNRLMVLANVKMQNQQIELGGTLHIQRSHSAEMDLIHFGCELIRDPKDPASKVMPKGWFYANNLPLEKFISPFLFRNGLLHMEGEGEFKGSFDDQMLSIHYDVEDLKIENEDLCIDIKHVHANLPGQLAGKHHFNFKNFSHYGTLPIQHASYIEKNSGLIFQDIQGMAAFDNQVIKLLPLEAYCEGIYFSGDLLLDYSDPLPGVFNLNLHFPILSGKISQIQRLLAHLKQPSLLLQIPLEGEITGKEEGLKIGFVFVPHDYHLQADFRGTVSEGSMPFEEADMALRGIYMDVAYMHNQQNLEFSDIQGTLLVGKPLRVEEYQLAGNHIRINQLMNPDINLDVAVKDGEEELFRLVGYTKEEKNGIKNFSIDPKLSHISCIYPQIWNCRIKDWSMFDQLEFSSQFDLNSLMVDLSKFKQTGFFFLSHHMLDKLSHLLPIQGKGFFEINCRPDRSYSFHLEGIGVKQGNSAEHYALLKGSKQDKKWIIDQIQWDDWNAYAELQQSDERWKIPFLGLNVGQSLLLGFEGDFIPHEGLLYAKLNFCELDLGKLDRWKTLQPFLTKWHPSGILKGKGEIEWSSLLTDPIKGFKCSFEAEPGTLTLHDLDFHILNPYRIELKGEEGVAIHEAQVELLAQNGKAQVLVQTLDYRPKEDLIRSLEFSFNVPAEVIQEVGEALHHKFPELMDSSAKETLSEVKRDGPFKGFFTLNNDQPNGPVLSIKFDDGRYDFKNRVYDLKKFEIQIAGHELNLSAFSQHERCSYQILSKLSWPTCQQGQTTFVTPKVSNPLIINWENVPETGLMIRSMQGNFSGCLFDLFDDHAASNSSDLKALKGKVALDFNRLSSLLPLEIAEKIQKLKLGSSYTFNGLFWIDPAVGKNLLETLYFKGNLSSQEAILKGFKLQQMHADLQYVPGRLDIQNFVIQDPAGTVKAASTIALLDPKQDAWSLYIPKLSVKNFNLSLLRDSEDTNPLNKSKFRSLLVKKIEIQDFYGDLNRFDNWQAQGSLHFTNPVRKNVFHPLFAIPGEIILRLGLDPNVLNPVTGTIYFDLQGDKFYMTKFKDVYSEGRGSKFYLAGGPNPSWMDFDGNLSMQVRMKQYNLIFKIAELFTVSVEGNIKKPRYNLQKQSHKPHTKRELNE